MIMSAIALAAAAAGGWTTYTNVRFAFSICYPRTFRPGRPPDNGDGLGFTARDGAILEAWGGNDSLEGGIAADRKISESVLPGITYRAGGANWYVLSGRGGGRTFYQRTEYRGGRYLNFKLSYPNAIAARYAPVVARMQRCLRAGPY